MVVRHYVGYYGGLVTGISFEVTYSTGTGIDHYTYTFTVGTTDTVIAVTIGSAAEPTLYIKANGSILQVAKAWKKVNGSLVEQDVTTLFSSSDKIIVGV